MAALLHPGRYWIHASHEGYQPFWGDQERNGFTVVHGAAQRYGLVVRMEAEVLATLKGRVVSREGLPVAGAIITVRNGLLEHSVSTDQNGGFTSRVNPQSVSITLRHPEYRTLRQDLGSPNPRRVPDAVRDGISLTVERKPFKVDVAAVDEEGRPVPLPRLQVAEVDPSTPGEVDPFFEISTSAKGSATFAVDPGLRYGFFLPAGTPWKIAAVTPSENVRTRPGSSYYEFGAPESSVKILLAGQ